MGPILDYLVSDRQWETPSKKKRKISWVSRSDTKVYLLALLQLLHLCSVNNRHCLSCLLPYRLTREYPIAFRDWEECPTPLPWQLNVRIQQKNRVSSKYKLQCPGQRDGTITQRFCCWQRSVSVLIHTFRLCEIHSSLPWGESTEKLARALHSLYCIVSPNSVSGG